MLPPLRRWIILSILAISFLLVIFHTLAGASSYRNHLEQQPSKPIDRVLHPGFFKPKFRWKNVQQKHPVETFITLPTGPPAAIPRVQHDFGPENLEHAVERKRRLRAVEEAFRHSWEGYRKNAWLHDEVSPLYGTPKSTFGDWAATLVDTLDTLWIMGLKKEFSAAVAGLRTIEFTSASLVELNVFETTIRYLGGLLSAYDVSGHKFSTLLQKAVELGDMLYFAFDTPNRMPLTHWNWQNTALGNDQQAKKRSLLAEVGSLTMEFTRLSQLTGDPKWYDAIARVTNYLEDFQNQTKIPGLWPVQIDTRTPDFTKDTTFSIGGMADSLYEYLPKQHMLLGGRNPQYINMYLTALPAIKQHILFRPLNPENRQMLVPGIVKHYKSTSPQLEPYAEHLSCFAGGMVALAAKLFRQTHDLQTARELVEGCIWTYESTPTGIAGEIMTALPCDMATNKNCTWNEADWQKAVVKKQTGGHVPENYVEQAREVIEKKKLAPGFTHFNDARYILRPEAIESIFILYRITGDESLQDHAWQMFQAINNATRTPIAYAALRDVRELGPNRRYLDSMESFWTAETLKYFYLIFSDPGVISLDDYVLNTEAHPLLRSQS